MPGDPSPELIAVQSAAAGPLSRHGRQGFGLSAAERRVIEKHAMELARQYLHIDGWTTRDVSSRKPYDYECKRDVEELIVEVKGTTSRGGQIVLTKGEVDAQLASDPNNALILVHSIDLIREGSHPKAVGGELLMFYPWKLNENWLRPIAFQYTVEGPDH